MRIPCRGRRHAFVAGTILWLALSGPLPAPVAGQPPPRPLAAGSVSGTLVSVDKGLNGVIIRNEAGQTMAWRLDRSVIDEVGKFKAGDRLWIIYRELGGGDRAVTAVGFPGTAPKPVYLNATGSTVRLLTGPFVDGGCRGVRETSQVSQLRLSRGSSTEDAAPCWCCTSLEETCEPANRSWEPGDRVTGKIILSRCFP